MKKALVIDQGNSTLKVHLYRGVSCIHSERFEHPEAFIDKLSSLLKRFEPERAIYSCTGSACYRNYINEVKKEIDTLEFTHSTPLPIRLNYAPASLGHDRIAGAAGAYYLLEEQDDFALVADSGTALTLDVVRPSGEFCGGNISCGLSMRFQALHDFTAALPAVDKEGDCPEFGTDTVTAIRAGAVRGLAAEIESSFQHAESLYGKGTLLLTGGDAAFLRPYIDLSLPVREEPTLVSDGLNRILQYNENIH